MMMATRSPLPHARRRQRAAAIAGDGAREGLEGDALVLVDQEDLLAGSAAGEKDVAQGRRGVLPDARSARRGCHAPPSRSASRVRSAGRAPGRRHDRPVPGKRACGGGGRVHRSALLETSHGFGGYGASRGSGRGATPSGIGRADRAGQRFIVCRKASIACSCSARVMRQRLEGGRHLAAALAGACAGASRSRRLVRRSAWRRVGGDARGQLARRRHQLLGRHHLATPGRRRAPRPASIVSPVKDSLRRLRHADHARQQPGAAVARDDADLDEALGEARRSRWRCGCRTCRRGRSPAPIAGPLTAAMVGTSSSYSASGIRWMPWR